MPRHRTHAIHIRDAFAALILGLALCARPHAQEMAVPAPPIEQPQQSTVSRIPVLAMMPLDSRGVGKNEVSAITDNLASKLQQSGKFRIMERSQMDQILKEQNFQQSGACDGNQCAVEMGKLLGIDRMVIGSVGLVGSTYTFNLRMIDVGSGEAVRTSARNHKGSIDEVLTDLVPAAVADLADLPQPTPIAMPLASTSEPAPAPAPANKGESLWPWLVGGAVVVAGGAAAAVLLTGGKSSSSSAGTSTGTNPTSADNHLIYTW